KVYPTRAASKWARFLEPRTMSAASTDVATPPHAAARTFSRSIGRLPRKDIDPGQASATRTPSLAQGGAAGRSLPVPGPPHAGRPARLQHRNAAVGPSRLRSTRQDARIPARNAFSAPATIEPEESCRPDSWLCARPPPGGDGNETCVVRRVSDELRFCL